MGSEYYGIVADEVSTSDATEQTLPIELNGAAAANEIAVPNGFDLFIQDVSVSTIDANAVPLLMKVQQSDDNGANWYTREPIALPAEGNVGDSLKANIRCRGNENGTLVRVRARTAAAGALSVRISGYLPRSSGA